MGFMSAFEPSLRRQSRAAVNVHQGGIGTTAEALRAGRPLLVVPFAFDQPDNAGRAEHLGVARSLPIKSYKAKRAVQELERLLHDSSYAQNAVAIGDRIRAEDGVRLAQLAGSWKPCWPASA